MDKNYEQIVPEQQRDQVFANLKGINKNNLCADCEKKNPKWASIHLGLHLCYDCAGKHRQYGVMYSFIKSTNLDAWNQKQLLYMQKGGNSRGLDYFRKCGLLSETHKAIDYKSPVVQKYKEILTAEVEAEIHGKPVIVKQSSAKKKEIKQTELIEEPESAKQIPNAEIVKVKEEKGKKKGKKKIGTKANIKFDAIEFDDGVPLEERDRIRKGYENVAQQSSVTQEQRNNQNGQENSTFQPKVEEPKELNEEEAKQRLEQFKGQNNVKNISSDAFKDTTSDQKELKQKLNKFQNSQSISSSAFNGQKEEEGGETMGKVKEMVSDVGGKIYNKLANWGWGNK